MKKVCFETFGCRLNKAEALQMEAEYLANGWELTQKHSEADLIVVRGCSVTRHAQEECEDLIAHLKRKYRKTELLVCGCLKDANPQPISHVSSLISHLSSPATIPTRTARAYLKVQDGCNGKCTFCIVPKFRGKSRSVDFEAVLDRALQFIDSGYREIIVTGCNLTLYASQGKRLPDLVAALAEIAAPAGCRIRLGSIEPGECAAETVDAMAAHDNVCRFLHLSIQSGSNMVLKAMGRPYQLNDIDGLINHATAKMPLLGLGCDLITGFPGENNLDFTLTERLLRQYPFSNAHVFPYSSRPGTPAASLSCSVLRSVRSTRAHILSDIAKAKRTEFAHLFRGKTVEVVIEKEEKTLAGWTGEYLRCHFVGNSPRKSLVKVLVTGVDGDLLHAKTIICP